MILKVTATNFTNKVNWIFRLIDNTEKEYFIMDNKFYEINNLKSPVTRVELDSLDTGQRIDCDFLEINGLRVVNKINKK